MKYFIDKFNFLSKLMFTAIAVVLLVSCESEIKPGYYKIQGFTMGTTYNVTFSFDHDNVEQLQEKIDKRLENINQLMSTYIDDSELSIFNANQITECQKLSEDTIVVIRKAMELAKSTKGKFDTTLAPLIEIWGFDKKDTKNVIPSQAEIDKLLLKIGSDKIRVEENCVAKAEPDLSVNLSAIAKGYAVDEIAKIIRESGSNNYLVEIGGEIALNGMNAKGRHWNIAIESASSTERGIQRVVSPGYFGVATSGDYRNYFEKDGKRYSHTIDPTTGYPIEHNLASVTVFHKSTMVADALATAMMVMGPELSINYAEKHDIPIFMLVKDGTGFREKYSTKFQPFLKSK